MARTNNLTNFLTDVADSIRSKTGKSELIACEDFDTEIESIETGGGGGSARLPSQYQEVEYIGITSGNGYIDTEFIPTYYSKAIVRGLMTSGTFLLGEDTSWANKGFGILSRYSYFSDKWSSVAITLNAAHEFIVSKNGYSVDGSIKDSFVNASTFTAEFSLYVFANHRNGSPDEYGKGRLYSLELYENDILEKQFIPCYEKATNIIGLYDLVDKKFHGVQGSGTWEKGDDHDTPIINLQQKEIMITENTTTNVMPDEGYVGLEKVSITTNVSGGTSRLPDGYQEVEYIESTGTQWINTGYTPNLNAINLEMKAANISTSGFVFGVNNGSYTNQSYAWFHNTASNQNEWIANNSNENTGIHLASNIAITFKQAFNNNYTTFQFNENTPYNSTKVNIQITKNLYLFGCNWNNESTNQPVAMRMYYCKISEYNQLVRDFVPCYRKSDDAIGLYDLVNDTFYTNSGTGVFGKGRDVGGINLQDKEITITNNTTTEITADTGYDGLGTVSVITNVPSSGSSIPIFSTTEVVVGTWIDDKPLYMKTLTGNITAGTSGAFDETIQTNITDSLSTLFIGENSFMIGTDGTSYPVNYVTIPSGNKIYLIKTAPSVTNKTVRAFSYGNIFSENESINYTINVFYTKTSDSAVSDVSTIGGRNYSTTEHIVENDGVNPIVYEKTITTSTTGYQNNHPVNKSLAHNISNVDKIWISDGSFCYSSGQTSKQMYPVTYLNYYSDLYRQHLHANVNKTNINVYVGDWVIAQGTIYHNVTLRYTKNTA